MTDLIRPYRPDDLEAVQRICVQTGDAGRDATGQHDDPRELTDRWATPYLNLEPTHAVVAERDGAVVGYVLGTADTRRFAARFEAGEWIGPAGSALDHTERSDHARHMLIPECDAFPAHLHIDILEQGRGGGLGRRLVQHFVDTLPAHTGVHVVVDPGNPGALSFYPRVGFERVRTGPDGVVFALSPERPTAPTTELPARGSPATGAR
ncbi:GNAT family N-acetyltransferase [Herbiconiux liukaitaii]|uniref:GNAT family N-acetyltransferase n=1 Tax=Herbiconiux liukaitaii TaxID=3342799 RepID=UPI0035B82C08